MSCWDMVGVMGEDTYSCIIGLGVWDRRIDLVILVHPCWKDWRVGSGDASIVPINWYRHN